MPKDDGRDRALVGNAADAGQVREARRTERLRRINELADLKAVLETPAGMRVLLRVLNKCRTFESIWHPSALIHFNAGQQDIGHFLLQEIVEAAPEAYLHMLQANIKEKKTDDTP